ncbi:MAG: hypothetical protein JST39_25375 [Bacteroidetes bacterium]|nr:hypothetical protein [Bacteroidota bacterium]
MKKNYFIPALLMLTAAAGFGQTKTAATAVPDPGSLYILNQFFPPQPNSNFNITGVGVIGGSTADIPLSVHSASTGRTAIAFGNTTTSNGSWLLNINPAGMKNPGAFSLINVLANQTPIVAYPNGYVGINSTATPAVALDVNGDINASGRFLLGMQYLQQDYSMGQGYKMLTLDCPAGYQVVSGGGGHRDLNGAVKDIHVAFSGPDEDAPATRWRLVLYNSSKSSRAVRINCACARIK